jgi:O-antigen/teichoic acid export membrane protein
MNIRRARGLTVDPGQRPARTPERDLRVNSLSLLVSGVGTASLGLGFWAVTARLYPVEEVGRATAIISVATMLATLSNLSLGAMYERFLPLAGVRTRALLIRGFAITMLIAALLGGVFLLLGPRSSLFESTGEAAFFPFFVVCWAVYTLLDQATNGLLVGRWAAAKNLFVAIAKIVIVGAFAWLADAFVIVLATAIPTLLAVSVVFGGLLVRAGRVAGRGARASLPGTRALWSYFGASYGITVLAVIPPLALPIIVVVKLGAAMNAYFALAWAVAGALLMLLVMMVGPFVSAVAAAPTRARSLTSQFIGRMMVIGGLGALVIAFVAPVALDVVGSDYSNETRGLLRLIAIAIPLMAVTMTYAGVARVRRRLWLALSVQALNAAIVVLGAWFLIDGHGLDGVGFAYLCAEATSAVVLVVPLLRSVRALERHEPAVLEDPLQAPTIA